MRILLLGANGMIGRSLSLALEKEGHSVEKILRNSAKSIDFNKLPNISQLHDIFAGHDILINAVGIPPGIDSRQQFRIQQESPCRIFDAALEAGIKRIIQISALSDSSAENTSPFIKHKYAADHYLLCLPGKHSVIRPSLVFAEESSSTRLLRQLSWLAWLPLPNRGNSLVQPIHLDDLVKLLVQIVNDDSCHGIIETGGSRIMSLREYIHILAGHGATHKKPATIINLPDWSCQFIGHTFKFFSRGLLGPDTLNLLRHDSCSLHTHPLVIEAQCQTPEQFLTPAKSQQFSLQIKQKLAFSLGRFSLAIVCFLSALIPLFWPSLAKPYEHLARLDLTGNIASIVFYSLIILDCFLGWCVLFCRNSFFWLFMACAIIGYSCALAIFMPEMITDPFGPVLKNIPMLAWIAALALLDSERRTA